MIDPSETAHIYVMLLCFLITVTYRMYQLPSFGKIALQVLYVCQRSATEVAGLCSPTNVHRTRSVYV